MCVTFGFNSTALVWFYGFRGRVIHDMHMCMCMHMHMSMLRNNAGERIECKTERVSNPQA